MVPPKERHSQAFPRGMRTVSGWHSGDARAAGAEGESQAQGCRVNLSGKRTERLFLPVRGMGESARPVV